MITKLSLKNFRKHEDRVFSFTEGLNVIRAPNEGGKTTIAEAIGYAMFGATALRDTVAETVTWDQPANSMSVRLEMTVGGKEVVVERSPRGAEVLVGGDVFVTGQSDVREWCEKELLGCNANTAYSLMLAGQTSLRGILESGPKATHQLVEMLSEFDVFDRLLEAASEQLYTGHAGMSEEYLVSAQDALEGLEVVAYPGAVESSDEYVQAEAELSRVQAFLADHASSIEVLSGKEQALTEQIRLHESYLYKHEYLTRKITETAELKKQLTRANHPVVDEAPYVEAVRNAESADELRKAWMVFESLPAWSGPRVDRKAFDEDATSTRSALGELSERSSELGQEIVKCEALLVRSSVCGFCDQDISQFPEAQRKNEELLAKIAETKASLHTTNADIGNLKARLAGLDAAEQFDSLCAQLTRPIQQHLACDDRVVPVTYVWNAPSYGKLDLDEAKRNLEQARLYNREVAEHTSKIAMLNAQTVKLMGERDALVVPELPPSGELEAIRASIESLQTSVGALDMERASIASRMADLVAANKVAVVKHNNYVENKQRLEDQIAAIRSDMELSAFNKALVRKLRLCRGKVASKLWGTVLGVVSTVFSRMRGEDSLVAQGDKGFTVNGRPVGSLSGSTLDILGLAVRASLVRVFLPTTPFLVLDEAAAACDADRSSSLIEYVAAAGFPQVVYITHEGVSEAVADNVIEV